MNKNVDNYGKKIDIFDSCYNDNNTNNNTYDNMLEDSIVINYPKSDLGLHSLTDNHTMNISEFLSIVEDKKRTNSKDKKQELISCSNFYHELSEIEEPLKRTRIDTETNEPTRTNYTEICNKEEKEEEKEIKVLSDDEINDDDLFNFIMSDNYTYIPPSTEEIYKELYESDETSDIMNSSDYDNSHFCFYCKNYLVLPNFETINFLKTHLIDKKNYKYLLLVFRLCPSIFDIKHILGNKYLKKYVYDYLGIKEPKTSDLVILNQYSIKVGTNFKPHVFENLFHQPDLKYTDYIKCDSCKNYLCPMHIHLGSCTYKKCEVCNDKTWMICGWCKVDFKEEYACKYIHQKN